MANVDPVYWGNPLWTFMYSIASSLSPITAENSNDHITDIRSFFQLLTKILPCDNCKDNYNEDYVKYPFPTDVNSTTVMEWIQNVKNSINLKIGKPHEPTNVPISKIAPFINLKTSSLSSLSPQIPFDNKNENPFFEQTNKQNQVSNKDEPQTQQTQQIPQVQQVPQGEILDKVEFETKKSIQSHDKRGDTKEEKKKNQIKQIIQQQNNAKIHMHKRLARSLQVQRTRATMSKAPLVQPFKNLKHLKPPVLVGIKNTSIAKTTPSKEKYITTKKPCNCSKDKII